MVNAVGKYGVKVAAPQNAREREMLCGWNGPDAAIAAMQRIVQDGPDAGKVFGDTFARFVVTGGGPDFSGAGKTVRAWDYFRKATGQEPDLTPQPTGNCFVPGSLVQMADGSEKPIQDVQVGDMVVSPTGVPRAVTRLFSRPYTGELVTMRTTLGMRPVTATPDHQFIHYLDRKFGKPRRVGAEQVNWCGIGSLQERDRVLVPYGMDYAGEYQTLDMVQLLGHDPNESYNAGTVTAGCIQDGENVRGKMHAVKRPIPTSLVLDERLARLIGLYAAEGTYEPHRIRFSYAADEVETLVAETVALIQSVFGLDCKIRYTNERKTGMQVVCYGKALADVFQYLVPGNVYTKGFPDALFRSPKTVRLAALRGWLDGDGHLAHKKKQAHNAGSYRIIGVTSSARMAESAARLALSCGLKPSCGVRKKSDHQNVAASTVNFTGSCVGSIYPATAPAKTLRQVDRVQHGLALPIKELTRTQMTNGTVYCIEVADEHAFVVNGYAVHNCVAAATDDILELTQCVEICNGDAEEFKPIYNPYHYATGRVLVGQNRLRGGAGSLGSWQAKAVEVYGSIPMTAGLPKYTAANVDAWGDDRPAEGKSFRDHLEEGKEHIIKTTAEAQNWEQLRDGMYAGHFATIASMRGYTMKADSDGFHRPSGQWGHQMSIWGYSENPNYPTWVAIKNQWGDLFGDIRDFETGELWPKGFLRVRLADFVKLHLSMQGAETFIYSGYEGFPALKFTAEGMV